VTSVISESRRAIAADALAEVSAASIEAVVALLLETDPDGTWTELEDDAAIRDYAEGIVTTGIVDEILTVESVRVLLGGGP
jgi:hypothetical protein